MSTQFDSTVSSPASEEPIAWGVADAGEEFTYKPVSPWGPMAIVCGVASLSAFLGGLFGLFLSGMGIIVGILAIVKIRREREFVRGGMLAVAGLAMSVFTLAGGSVLMAHEYANECPEGYIRVNFPRDISAKMFVFAGGERRIHPDVQPLIGQDVFLKGYMWQTPEDDFKTQFTLLKDNGECCFGGKPAAYDAIAVVMDGELTTQNYTGMVSVAGRLEADISAPEEQLVYSIKAILVEPSRTRF